MNALLQDGGRGGVARGELVDEAPAVGGLHLWGVLVFGMRELGRVTLPIIYSTPHHTTPHHRADHIHPPTHARIHPRTHQDAPTATQRLWGQHFDAVARVLRVNHPCGGSWCGVCLIVLIVDGRWWCRAVKHV